MQPRFERKERDFAYRLMTETYTRTVRVGYFTIGLRVRIELSMTIVQFQMSVLSFLGCHFA